MTQGVARRLGRCKPLTECPFWDFMRALLNEEASWLPAEEESAGAGAGAGGVRGGSVALALGGDKDVEMLMSPLEKVASGLSGRERGGGSGRQAMCGHGRVAGVLPRFGKGVRWADIDKVARRPPSYWYIYIYITLATHSQHTSDTACEECCSHG